MMSVEFSSEKARSKRTLNHFFEGLFKVFNDKRNYNPKSRAENDHHLSPLATFAKLSSISTQPRKFDALDDDNFDDDDAGDRKKLPNISSSVTLPMIHVSPTVKNIKNKTSISHSNARIELTTEITSTLNDSNVEASTISSIFSTEMDRHTTQFFNGSSIVEKHHDDHQVNDSEISLHLSTNFSDFLTSLNDGSGLQSKNEKRSKISLANFGSPFIYLFQPHVQFHTAGRIVEV